jgi:WD40 repeat protein
MNVLKFSEQARTLVACYGARVVAWDLESGRELLHHEMNPIDRHLNTAAFVPGTNLLAVGTERNGVQFWDLGRREMVRHCQGKNASTQQIAISPDGRYMMTWGNTGRGNPLRVWRLPEWS